MNEKDFFKKISSSGDIASFSLGFVIGALLDLLLDIKGLSASNLGFISGVFLIGLKNGVDSLSHYRAYRNIKKLELERKQLLLEKEIKEIRQDRSILLSTPFTKEKG